MNGRSILQQPWDISPRDEAAPPWSRVENKAWEAHRMAVYAAMIDRMDQSIGRLGRSSKSVRPIREHVNPLPFGQRRLCRIHG